MHEIREINFLANKFLFDSTWPPVQIAWESDFTETSAQYLKTNQMMVLIPS